MQFTKVFTGHYKATRKDGQVIHIESRTCDETGKKYWASTYEGDDYGDNTSHAKTKKDLVNVENYIEANM